MKGGFAAAGFFLRVFRPFLLVLLIVFGLVLAPSVFPDHGEVYRAIVAGDDARVRTLLDRGANPNARRAVLSELSRYLLRRNTRAATPDFREQTPLLIIAITKGQYPIARLLLERGADPNARDKAGYTVLAHAVLSGDPELVRLLLARGADPAARMPDGATALREGPSSGGRLRISNSAIQRMLQSATAATGR